MHQTPNRRDVLKLGAGLGLGALLANSASARTISAELDEPTAPTIKPARTRLLRVAHLTDFHIQPERDAFKGVGECLRHAQSLKDKPQVIVTGGDLIMDGFGQPHDRTKTQWGLWKDVLKSECAMPVLHTLGNHDIWGWDKKGSKTQGEEHGWGKAWACEMIEREKAYAYGDVNGVRIVMLDSVRPDNNNGRYGYVGYLEDEQYAWFESLLQSTPKTMPVLVVSHIPIVSATGLIGPKPELKTDDVKVSRGIMHADASRLAALFAKHPNV